MFNKRMAAGAAAAAMVLTGFGSAVATPAFAIPLPPPIDVHYIYPATADLDGRVVAKKLEGASVAEGRLPDFVKNKERVSVVCQAEGEPAYGSKIWDVVTHKGKTLYVPDHYIQTGTDDFVPAIPRCEDTEDDVITQLG